MNRYPLLSIVAFGWLFCTESMAQTLDYEWLNLPCEQYLSCANGCSACNLPDEGSPIFIGTNVVWTGISTCPHPISIADNAVYTEGWPMEAQPTVWVGLSAFALEPLQIDSIVVRHRRSPDGPQRLRISYARNPAQASEMVSDVEVTQQYQESVVTDLGCLDQAVEGGIAALQIRLQAYQGGAGDWQLDAIRIVASPCSAINVGIAENFQRDLNTNQNVVDVLGRSIQGQPAPGVYVGNRKRVQLY